MNVPTPQPPGPPPDLVPTAAACKLAGCAPGALHRLRLRGRLTGYRRHGRWLWSRAELLARPRPATLTPGRAT